MNTNTRLAIIIPAILALLFLALLFGVRWIAKQEEAKAAAALAARAQRVQAAKERERRERQMDRIRAERIERETETTEAKRERTAEARERAAAALEQWLEDGRPFTGSRPTTSSRPTPRRRARTIDFCRSTQRLERIMFGGWAFVGFNGSLRPVGNDLPKAILDAADQWAVGTPRTIELRRAAAIAGACP